MAEERTRLQVLKELKQVQAEITKLEQEGAKKSVKAAKDLQTYREYELELMRESSKILESNLKKYASEEKSIGRISNVYQSLKTSQLETVNIAKSTKGLKDAEIDQITNLLSLSRDLSELTIEEQTQIEAKTAEYSNAFSELSDNIKGNKELIDSLAKQNELALTYTKQTQTQKKVNEAIIAAQEKVKTTFQGISETVGITLEKLKSGRGAIGFLVLGAGKFAEKLGQVNKELGRVGEGLGGAYTTTSALGFLFDTNVESIKALSTEFGGLEKASSRVQVSTNLIANNFGISATDAAKLQQQFAALNNGSIDVANNLIETTQQFALQNNLIPSQLVADLAANTERFALFGKNGGQNMLQAAGYAAKLGVSLDKVAGVAENLLDFESSITKELELSALLGKQLNLDKARQLAFDNDIAGATQEVLRQIGGIAAFERMNYYQRKQTADLLGVSVEEFKKMALNQNKANSLGAIQTEQFSNQNEFLGMIGNKFAGTILKGAGNFLLLMALANRKTSMLAGMFNGIGKAITFLPKMMIKFIKQLVTANALTRAQKKFSDAQILFGFGGLKAKAALEAKMAAVQSVGNTASATTGTAAATANAAKNVSVGASLKALAGGLKAMGTPQVLFGALNLIPTALGFVAMTAGVLGLAGVAAMGVAAGVGLKALAAGLVSLGLSAEVAIIGVGLLATFGLALIPVTYALSLLSPVIESIGTALMSVFGGVATILDSVFGGIVSFVDAITLEKVAALGLLSLAFYGLAASLAAVGSAGIFALPALLGIAAAAGGLAIVADIFGITGSSDEGAGAVVEGGENFESQNIDLLKSIHNTLKSGHVLMMNGEVVGRTLFRDNDLGIKNQGAIQ